MRSNVVGELDGCRSCWISRKNRFSEAASAILLALVFLGTGRNVFAQNNPGDPLFCQPNEGTTFLIVNGGAGIFTVDPDCYNNNIANDTTTTITTSQGGTLTLNAVPGGGNYTYTPPTAGFTGLDTFTIPVTTSWNATGGPGSAGGTHLARPGGADTVAVTLNVLPATTTAQVLGASRVFPLPTSPVTGCGPQGNSGQGPASSVIVGCITALGLGPFRSPASMTTAHGTVVNSGSSLKYTPTAGYMGSDSFTYHVFGTNTDGSTALDSGAVTMQLTVNPTLSITTSALPAGQLNAAYTAVTFAATGGVPSYTFSLASGSLPPGLNLTGGVLSGTPTTSGTSNFVIQVTDSVGNSFTAPFSINVPVPVPTLGTSGLLVLTGLLVLFGARTLVHRQA